MSAIHPKADIAERERRVRFVPKADIAQSIRGHRVATALNMRLRTVHHPVGRLISP
jgi:hypothetical protein